MFRLEFGSISLGFNYVEWAKTQNFTECAQLFQISTARDFAKGPYKQVKLPEPRQIGQCVKCETMLSSQCYIDKCLCVERSTKYCCLCVGHDIKHAKLDESEQFNFGSVFLVFMIFKYLNMYLCLVKHFLSSKKSVIDLQCKRS